MGASSEYRRQENAVKAALRRSIEDQENKNLDWESLDKPHNILTWNSCDEDTWPRCWICKRPVNPASVQRENEFKYVSCPILHCRNRMKSRLIDIEAQKRREDASCKG